MSLPKIVREDEWTAARREFLDEEKAFTRARDRLSTARRELPMVEVTKPYELEGPDGTRSLLDVFEGRRQLIVYHFMFHPDWEDGCPSCTAGTDELAPGFVEHLNVRDTTYALVSRAPLATLERWKARHGWTHPVVLDERQRLQLRLRRHDRRLARLRRVQLPDPRRVRGTRRGEHEDVRAALRHAGAHVLPRRRRPGVPHVLGLRTRPREHRRLVLLPRPDGARPPGGLGATGRTDRAARGATSPTSRP